MKISIKFIFKSVLILTLGIIQLNLFSFHEENAGLSEDDAIKKAMEISAQRAEEKRLAEQKRLKDLKRELDNTASLKLEIEVPVADIKREIDSIKSRYLNVEANNQIKLIYTLLKNSDIDPIGQEAFSQASVQRDMKYIQDTINNLEQLLQTNQDKKYIKISSTYWKTFKDAIKMLKNLTNIYIEWKGTQENINEVIQNLRSYITKNENNPKFKKSRHYTTLNNMLLYLDHISKAIANKTYNNMSEINNMVLNKDQELALLRQEINKELNQ